MKKLNLSSIALIAGILLLVNLLSQQYFFRIDLTEDNQYTLSQATLDILDNLEDPVTITAYFSEHLPPDIARTRRDFRDMLTEYATRSKGMVDYEFISPNEDEALQEEAVQAGIRPVMINVREQDQVKQQKAFLGAVLKMGEGEDVIPFIQPGTAMEYALSTSIKKLSVQEKPSVGIIQGHGEPSLSDLSQVFQSLSILYSVENLDLSTEEEIPARYKAVALVGPQDTIPPRHFQKLDAYLAAGGKVFVAVDAVEGDFSTARGSVKTTGVISWLAGKGLQIEPSFAIDASCGTVNVQQRQGFFTIQQPVQFPYLPLIKRFPDHPITKGLEQVMLEFASPLTFTGDTTQQFTPILQTSGKANAIPAPTVFDVMNKQWSDSDFPMSNITLGGVLQGTSPGGSPFEIVVITDGNFPVSGEGRGKNSDNISLMVNSIDWLSDDTGLIELRTKGVTTRPIEEVDDSKRSFLKYLNFGLPLVLVLLYGIFRNQRSRNIRIRRMQEDYS